MKSKDKQNNLIIFFKANWVKLILILCSFIVLAILSAYFIPEWIGRKKFENDILNFSNTEPIFSLSKIYCYSSASGVNNSKNKAMWNLNISQYTDIALYLNILNTNENLTNKLLQTQNIEDANMQVIELNNKNSISKLYIDNINFSNNNTGNLSLNYVPFANFSKLSEEELTTPKEQPYVINFDIVDSLDTILNNSTVYSNAVVDEILNIPITLRYFNYNLKTNCTVSSINEALSFNGNLLKRATIPLSSIKNEISFTIHIVNKLGEEYKLPVSIQIPLQNNDNSKNIYDGFYTEEKNFENNYFYLSK